MKKLSIKLQALLFWGALFTAVNVHAEQDTLRIMTYNVLYYGDRPACQGSHTASHGYLRSIVEYANPDVIGLEKMAAIPMYAGDHSGSAPAGFADSIVQFSLNAAFPGRYTHCPYTNNAAADDMAVLFYDQQKLGFVGILCTYSNINDFTTYKLYYKSADLATTHDTVFLYVTLNHTNSGSSGSDAGIRAGQIAGEMAQIATHFTSLPNLVNMGDFNTHNSSEACYQTLVAPSNPGYRFYDPPFSLDASLSYPADWDNHPDSYAGFLTTSTRLSSVPNNCGSSGGGKSWYDHIFLSQSIVNNTDGLTYIPHSYRTIGNDGSRVGRSINDAPANTSAPPAIIEALFQMSNKFPVMVDLALNTDNLATHTSQKQASKVQVANPVSDLLYVQFSNDLIGKSVHIQCTDMVGRIQMNTDLVVTASAMQLPCTLLPGTYCLRFFHEEQMLSRILIIKDR